MRQHLFYLSDKVVHLDADIPGDLFASLMSCLSLSELFPWCVDVKEVSCHLSCLGVLFLLFRILHVISGLMHRLARFAVLDEAPNLARQNKGKIVCLQNRVNLQIQQRD